MRSIFDYTLDELADIYIKEFNQKKYRAVQTYKWLYEEKINDLYEMTDLPYELRHGIVREFTLNSLKEETVKIASDGTKKFLFTLEDGSAVETVLMKYDFGNSVCVSSQVGCRMGCKFCASSKLTFGRNLTSGEIVEQIIRVSKYIGDRISNVVFMGIGEPFDNYDNVMRAVDILNNPHGLNIGARHITVSTSGLIPQIMQFAESGLQCNLSISLHATTDKVRDSIMPVNKAYNIANLIQACKKYIEKTNRRVTFEYAMMYGVNDSIRNACELSELLKGMICHVNLIPINAIEGGEYRRSPQNVVMAFRDALNNRGITATVRRELGNDIEAACGQLRRKYYE